MIVDVSFGIPVILHWGAPVDEADVLPEALQTADVQPFGSPDSTMRIPVVPLHGEGFTGRPGLQGHRRGGRHWAPRFRYVDHRYDYEQGNAETEQVLIAQARDDIAELVISTRLTLDNDGVLTVQVTLTNDGDSPYMVDAFSASLMIPESAVDLGVYAGRWVREFQLHRFVWPYGAWTSENRSGRTSHEHPPYVWAMSSHAGEWQGEVWGVHLAWSGNHVLYAETLPTGQRYIQAGELFQPGEICVDPGESLTTPVVIGVYSSHGLTPASWGYHRIARRQSPRQQLGRQQLGGQQSRPRPVHINTWEAVYFNHDFDRLRQLADTAASVGIERFVLDDGWFGGRRHDRAGLGDWFVSADVYPQGLQPLIDHVTALGMEFGIWVEPEMVNPDSDLYRQHPSWALTTPGYEPILGRHQLVLDLTHHEAWQHIFERLNTLLAEHQISYVKWDMNRPHIQASNAQGKAATHGQTLAVYALFDALRGHHPHVEFESCASGGGRIDHEILRRVERVWTSDSNDALERQLIQRGASMLIPAEVMGSHIGPPRAHTSHRQHTLSFRGVTALFGHLGVEWDITTADDRDRQHLAHLIGVHQQYRYLLHHGDTVRFDTFEHTAGAAVAHGVYAPDRCEALISYSQLQTPQGSGPSRLRLPDLIADQDYVVSYVPLAPEGHPAHNGPNRLGPALHQPAWIQASLDGTPWRVSGAVLGAIGLPVPVLWPESAVLVHLSSS